MLYLLSSKSLQVDQTPSWHTYDYVTALATQDAIG